MGIEDVAKDNRRARDRAYYSTVRKCDPEKMRQKREQESRWRNANRSRVRECARRGAQVRRKRDPDSYARQQADWENRNIEKVLFKAARNRARKKGMEFTITLEDVKMVDVCPYLNIKIETTRGTGRGLLATSPSLDRINNQLGYVKGNVQVISHMANVMKSSATVEQLRAFATAVLRIH